MLAIRSPVVAAAAAGFAVSTLAGYLLSVWFGLFGFTEVRTTAGLVAGVIEVAAFAVLALLAVAPAAGAATAAAPARPGSGVPGLGAAEDRLRSLTGRQRAAASRAVAGLAAVALVVLGVAVAGAGSSAGSPTAGATPPPGSGAVLTVVIKNFKFTPAAPRVRPGQRVEVKNEDSVAHTLSAGPAAKFSNAFNTGLVAPGHVMFFTAPTQAGAYPFYCKVHPFMTGMLVVGKSAAAAAALSSFGAALRAHPAAYCGRRPAGPAAAAQAAAARRPRAARPPRPAGRTLAAGRPGAARGAAAWSSGGG